MYVCTYVRMYITVLLVQVWDSFSKHASWTWKGSECLVVKCLVVKCLVVKCLVVKCLVVKCLVVKCLVVKCMYVLAHRLFAVYLSIPLQTGDVQTACLVAGQVLPYLGKHPRVVAWIKW